VTLAQGFGIAADPFDLDHYRTVGDKPLDDIIVRLGEELDGYRTVASLFPRVHDLVRMSEKQLMGLRSSGLVNDELIEFLAGYDRLPDREWIHRDTIREGGEFYRSHGLLAFLVLAGASLPACYCWDNEARVLGYTRKLMKHGAVPRRLPETAQFVIDFATEDAFEPDGPAIRAARKVRLIHAIIRYLIVRPMSVDIAISKGVLLPDPGPSGPHHHQGDDWRPGLGVPISQEFLVGTLLTFSHVVLKGLGKLGVLASEREQRAYLHRWNALGYFMGIDEKLLRQLDSPWTAESLFENIMQRNRRGTEHGYSMEAALLDYQRNNVIARIPGGRLQPARHMPAIVTRGLAGRKTCRALYLQLNGFEVLLYLPMWASMKFVGLLSNLSAFEWLTQRIIGYVAMNVWGWSREDQVGQQASIDSGELRPRGRMVIPTSLMETWRLNEKGSAE
jgi:hypothetical protein